jgi:hypothetical protein
MCHCKILALSQDAHLTAWHDIKASVLILKPRINEGISDILSDQYYMPAGIAFPDRIFDLMN